jgi:alpha-L-rhamnosidase
MLSNFVEVPTDCPQRDERLGWTGDAQVFAPTSCYLNESHAFWRKWLRDLMADQREDGAIPHVCPDPTRGHEAKVPGFYGSTGWGDAIVLVSWTLYLHYGDRDVLAETFPAMVRWVDFLWSISKGPVVRPPRQWGKRGFSFGDWLQPSGPTEKPFPTIGDDAAATIYHYISTDRLATIATLLGKADVAADMRKRADAIRDAFAFEFVTPSGRLAYDDQTSYALAFEHGLIPPEKREGAKEYFRRTIDRAEGRLQTGFIGTPALLPALVSIGEAKRAVDVFLQEEVPGWLYQVKNGATTIWERWDAIRADGSVFAPDMNSFNHYAYGAVCQWLFEAAGGFRPDPEKPGFERILFEPLIDARLGPFSARHDTRFGAITSRWIVEEDSVAYDFTVPPGAEGLWLRPAAYPHLSIDSAKASGSEPIRIAAGDHRARFRLTGT